MYDIASALRRRAAAERLEGLGRAGERLASDLVSAADGLPAVNRSTAPADVRPPTSPAATIANLLRSGGSPLFFAQRR